MDFQSFEAFAKALLGLWPAVIVVHGDAMVLFINILIKRELGSVVHSLSEASGRSRDNFGRNAKFAGEALEISGIIIYRPAGIIPNDVEPAIWFPKDAV